ncbi:MAG: aldehyde dehydrogenase family protein [Burkholderiaceae bacterium]
MQHSSTRVLAKVAVGVPPGAHDVVHGFGSDAASGQLTRHDDVDAIAFTGETRAIPKLTDQPSGTNIMR